MPYDGDKPLSDLTTEELIERLEGLRARRAQPRGTSASRTPGVIGPGESTPRRGGSRRRISVDELDLASALGLDDIVEGPSDPA